MLGQVGKGTPDFDRIAAEAARTVGFSPLLLTTQHILLSTGISCIIVGWNWCQMLAALHFAAAEETALLAIVLVAHVDMHCRVCCIFLLTIPMPM